MIINEHGFSAVELLITLFIGALFLLSGYTLWSYTQREGAESYQFSIASNIAYDYVRRYDASVGCSATPILSNQPVTENTNGLPNPRVTVTKNCPINGDASIVKITSTVTYSANPTKSVSHAIYAN